MATRILMILTSHEDMGISGKKTGNWFDEVATPYYTFKERGFDVVLASSRGGVAPIDPFSYDDKFQTDYSRRFLEDDAALRALSHTSKLSEVYHSGFDALFFPGGYGQLWDLANDSWALRMIQDFVEADRPVAMVCHGPAILRDAKASDGRPLVQGRKLTGFTNAEDDELDLSRHLLFQLESALQEKGATFIRAAKNWQPHVVEDGALITGQNPASATAVATALCKRLATA